MIRATMIGKEGPIGFIGISEENVVRMRAGMPLDIKLGPMTPPGMLIQRVIVHLATTYEQVIDEMIEGGLPEHKEIREAARELDAQAKSRKRPEATSETGA